MPDHRPARILADPSYPALKAWILARTGLGYWGDKDRALAERLRPVLESGPDLDCAGLLAALASERPGGRWHRALLAEVTVGETYFFRFPDQFAALRDDVLPQCIRRNAAERRLSIWSAGCSNGAEPYSLAILLRGMAELDGWTLRILATDISPAQLEAARAAEYTDWSLRDMPEARRRACFERHGAAWRLKPAFKAGVEFRQHNLASDGVPPGAPFDLVLCRNVLIYFAAPVRAYALGLLSQALRPGGWALFGHAEGGLELAERFEPVRYPEATLYRKPEGQAPPRPPWPAPPPPDKEQPPPAPSPPPVPAPQHPPAQPPEPGALRDAAEALADGGQWDELLAHCRVWAGHQPLDPLPHYYEGLAFSHIGGGDAASAYRRAVYLDRAFTLAHFQLGRTALQEGDAAAAARHFRNVAAMTARAAEDAPVRAGGSLTAGELRMIALRWLEKAERS